MGLLKKQKVLGAVSEGHKLHMGQFCAGPSFLLATLLSTSQPVPL